MNNDSQILTTMQKLVELQEESQAIQRQSLELQKTAIENQARAIAIQATFGRLYKIVLIVGAIIVAGFIFVLSTLFT